MLAHIMALDTVSAKCYLAVSMFIEMQLLAPWPVEGMGWILQSWKSRWSPVAM